MFGVLRHVGRPIIENLYPPQADIPILNIYPAIGNNIPERLYLRLIPHFQLIQKQPHRNEIPIRKFGCDAICVARNMFLADCFNEILYRHGRNKVIRRIFPAVRCNNRGHFIPGCFYFRHRAGKINLPSHFHYLFRHLFVELARSLLGI